MELNGVANIHMIVDSLFEKLTSGQIDKTVYEDISSIKDQLDLLERYMLAYKKAAGNALVEAKFEYNLPDIKAPYWHEVKAEPSKFPNNRERFQIVKK